VKLILSTQPKSDVSPEITRKYINYGSSPRGALAIIKSAKIKAILEGRESVSFDDIKNMAYPALRHRIFVNYEGISKGIDSDKMIKKILESIDS
jgi:MoxR-like ATPase